MSNNPSVYAQQDRFSGVFPPVLPSSSTITPVSIVNFVSGTVQISTITPITTGPHLLVLIFTNSSPGTFLTTGNIAVAITPLQNIALLLAYDPRTEKYYSMASGVGGSGTPAAPTASVQFNDSGVFGGDADFTWDKTTNKVKFTAASGLSFAASSAGGNGPITVVGGDSGAGDPALIIDNPTDGYLVIRYPQFVQENFDGGGGIISASNFSINTGSNVSPYGKLTFHGRFDVIGVTSADIAAFKFTSSHSSGTLTLLDGLLSTVNNAAAVTNDFTALRGYANLITGGSQVSHIGVAGVANVSNAVVSGSSVGGYFVVSTQDTATITSGYGSYASLVKGGGTTVTNFYAHWAGDLFGLATNGYAFWYDGGPGSDATKAGVFRVNDRGILAYYNPAFTKYNAGSTNFEREILRWGDTGTFGTDNIAYFGVEVSGSGTLRHLALLGAGIGFESTPGAGTFLEGFEMTAPAAGAANTGRIFFQDNGSGKTQLMVIFNTGAAQQIAIQP